MQLFLAFVAASADVPIHYDEGNLRHFQARWLHNCSTALPSGVVEYRDSDGIQPVCKFINNKVYESRNFCTQNFLAMLKCSYTTQLKQSKYILSVINKNQFYRNCS